MALLREPVFSRVRAITEISADYGYSSSNYSSAFRTHYHMTPICFRRKSSRLSMEHPFFHQESWKAESFEECSRKITMREMPDYRVIYERRFGSYEALCEQWERFIQRYQEHITEKTIFLERTYDDPAVTKEEHCLSDICMSVGENCLLENVSVIQGGKCAVYGFKGSIKHIYAAYQTIFLVWMPRTGYVLDGSRSLFDVYHTVEEGSGYLEMDICVPVKE